MHPDLLSNSIFLRYYSQWQEDPSSVVFVAIAEYLLGYGLADEAIKVSREGLKHHPRLVLGHLSLAKAHLRKKDWARAKESLQWILKENPGQQKALELLELAEKGEVPPAHDACRMTPDAFQTVTMAKIYASQGHPEKAREICRNLLRSDPRNTEALQELARLEGKG